MPRPVTGSPARRATGRPSRIAASAAFAGCFALTMWGVVGVAGRPGSVGPAPAATLAGAVTPQSGTPTIGPAMYDGRLALRRRCTPHWCLHWVAASGDAPARRDADGDGLPDVVLAAARLLEAGPPPSRHPRQHLYLLDLDARGWRAWCAGSACAVDSRLADEPPDFAALLVAEVAAALAAQ